MAVAAVAEVADVPPCCVQEAMNAMPIRAMINDKTDLFIGMIKVEGAEWPSTQSGCKKIICILKEGLSV